MSRRRSDYRTRRKQEAVEAAVDAGYEALMRHDEEAAMRHNLQACIEAGGCTIREIRMRYVLFQQLDAGLEQLTHKNHRAQSQSQQEQWEILKSTVVDNTNEPSVLFRAYASYLYACNQLISIDDIDPDSEVYQASIQFLEQAVTLCDSASEANRLRRVIVMGTTDKEDTAATGTLLDKIRSRAVNEMEYLKCPWEYFSQMFSECSVEKAGQADSTLEGINKDIAKKMERTGLLTATSFTGHPRSMFMKPPVVTSNVIEKITALPTDDTTVLIVPYAFLPSTESTAMGPIPFMPGIHDRSPVRVFTVDMDRFRSGETTMVFDQIQALFCGPKEARQKDLVAAFAATCLHPYVHMRGQKQTHPAARPTKVLLTPTDSNDAHVLLFLKTMMGVEDVEEADLSLLNLLNNTWDEVNARSCRHLMPFDKMPAMHDMALGVKCMNCDKIGAGVKACPCGKAWFCGKECQRKKWPEHKKDHKLAMKLREELAARPQVLFSNTGVEIKPFLRVVSSQVNCSLQAPALLHWYLSLIQHKNRDPFAPVKELKLIDVTKYVRCTYSNEELSGFIFGGRGRSSFATARHLIDGPAIICNDLTPKEILDNHKRYGPGLISTFHVYPDFKKPVLSHCGLPLPEDGSDEILGQHSMVLVKVRAGDEGWGSNNCRLLMQNCWPSKQFVEVDLVYFRACKARLIFFEGPPKEPSDDWSMPAGDITSLEMSADLESDDYFEED